MNLWLVRLVDENLDLQLDPFWIVATFGGTTDSEFERQIEDVKETIITENSSTPSKGFGFDVRRVEFNAIGILQLDA